MSRPRWRRAAEPAGRRALLPLAQVSGATLHQSLAGRLLRFGRILISGTGADLHAHPLGEVNYVPYPNRVLAELRSLLDPHPARGR